MRTSPAGRTAIMQREGFRTKAYRDTKGILTIGVGHTGRASPPVVTEGMVVNEAQVNLMLANDLGEFERAVNAKIVKPLTQNQFDACVSLAFNIGADAFAHSTVAREIALGNLTEAADAFMMWVKPPELKKRRQSERAQFLRPDGQAAPKAPTSAAKAAAGASAVVVAAGATAAASNGSPGIWITVGIAAVLALVLFLVLHFRKKA